MTQMKDLPINFTTYKKGDIITGTIVLITKAGAVVNIGGMRDGFVPNDELDKVYKEGDAILVMVKGYLDDKNCLVLDAKNVNRIIEEKEKLANIKIGSIIEFTIAEVTSAGLKGDYYGYHVFVPFSQIRDKDFLNKKHLQGRTIEIVVLELNNYKKTILGSSKILTEKTLSYNNIILNEGDIVEGSVLVIQDKYALVLLDNGIKAKLNISDVSYDKINSIADVLEEGKKYEFAILSTNEDHSRTIVGYKQMFDNPMIEIISHMKPGDSVTGEVIKLYPSGALIRLTNGATAFAFTKDNTDKLNVPTHNIFHLKETVSGIIGSIDYETSRLSFIKTKPE